MAEDPDYTPCLLEFADGAGRKWVTAAYAGAVRPVGFEAEVMSLGEANAAGIELKLSDFRVILLDNVAEVLGASLNAREAPDGEQAPQSL